MISQLIDKVKLKDAYLPEWRQRMRRVVQSDAAALHHYHLSPPPRTPSISIIIITAYHMISEWRVWARRGQYSIVVTIAAINILFSGPTVDMSAISDVYCYEDDTRIQFKYSVAVLTAEPDLDLCECSTKILVVWISGCSCSEPSTLLVEFVSVLWNQLKHQRYIHTDSRKQPRLTTSFWAHRVSCPFVFSSPIQNGNLNSTFSTFPFP